MMKMMVTEYDDDDHTNRICLSLFVENVLRIMAEYSLLDEDDDD